MIPIEYIARTEHFIDTAEQVRSNSSGSLRSQLNTIAIGTWHQSSILEKITNMQENPNVCTLVDPICSGYGPIGFCLSNLRDCCLHMVLTTPPRSALPSNLCPHMLEATTKNIILLFFFFSFLLFGCGSEFFCFVCICVCLWLTNICLRMNNISTIWPNIRNHSRIYRYMFVRLCACVYHRYFMYIYL